MNKKHLLLRATALISCAVIVWLFVVELLDTYSMPGLSAVIAIGVTGLTALLVWNQSLKVQLLTAALLCSTITILFRVMIADNPARKITKQLRGAWASVPVPGHRSTITLDFIDDHVVDVNVSNVNRYEYEITRNQELVLRESGNTNTFEILYLKNDSLRLKMEFETLVFVRRK